MAMLAEVVELVIGVDTHNDTHTATVVVTGAVVEQATVAATPVGYRQLLRLADRQDGRRGWAIESPGGYGAGLTRFLATHDERVVELDRPSGPPAATAPSPTPGCDQGRQALARDRLAQPRAAGQRAAWAARLAARRSAVQAATDAQRQLHASPPQPTPERRDRRAHPSDHHPRAGLAAGVAHPMRGGPDRGRHRPVCLVSYRPLPDRRRLRHARRRRPHPRLLGPDGPGAAESLRRPPAQPGPARHRPDQAGL
jgi:hypothetical protein